MRKEAGLRVSDRVRVTLLGPPEVERAAREHRAYIAGEVLATALAIGSEHDQQATDGGAAGGTATAGAPAFTPTTLHLDLDGAEVRVTLSKDET
jgi:isoleucyl-tRNA synthetase